MVDQDAERFAGLIVGIAELYNKKCSPELIAIYHEAPKVYDIEAIAGAFTAHMLDPDVGSYMPKPADIVRVLDGGKEDRALRAWAKVERAIKYYGSYSGVVFDDPIMHVIIRDMGGWIGLCATSQDEIPYRANEFAKRYRGYVQRPSSEAPARLIGRIEADGGKDMPVVIGDKEKARPLLLALYPEIAKQLSAPNTAPGATQPRPASPRARSRTCTGARASDE